MYFPWIGMFEQIKLCDVFIFYDDVAYSKGSFVNRVQIKTDTGEGFTWLTVPLKKVKIGDKINAVEIDYTKSWQNTHLMLLKQHYKKSAYFKEMMEVIESLFSKNYKNIGELSAASMELIIDYYNLNENKSFYTSSKLLIEGKSTQRVFDLVNFFKGSTYITGHGAKNYLDHELFEKSGINIEYMDYMKKPYLQQSLPFNPYVSILDLIANCGKEGKKELISKTKNWRNFINESA